MPSGMAAQVRELLASSDKTGLVLQRAPPSSSSKTGFVNVIQVKGGLFQARLQVQGDGRGGEKKRRQVGIPGLFKTAEEAAQLLALVKKIGPKTLWPEEGLPPKLDKQHKQRSHAAACTAAMRAPLVDVPMPAIVVFGTPIPFPAMNAPIVAASPLPMMPFEGSTAL